ncbi:MAG: hypothetical protein ACMG5Z_02340 [Luteimonas sp.]
MSIRRPEIAVERLVVAAVLLAILVGAPDGARAQSRKKIAAQAVEATGEGIKGAFEIRESPSGILSPGTGGACLLFSKQARGGSACRQDSDCTPGPEFVGGSAYCLHRNSDPRKKGRCWSRPAGNYCLRLPTVPHPLDTNIEFPLDATGKLQPVSNPKPGWWRVHACLSGTVTGSCGYVEDADKMFSDGPPTRIP